MPFSPLAAFTDVWTTKKNRAHQPCSSARDVFRPRNFDCGAFYMNRMSGELSNRDTDVPYRVPCYQSAWWDSATRSGVVPPIVERIESRLDLDADFAAVLVGHDAVAVGAL